MPQELDPDEYPEPTEDSEETSEDELYDYEDDDQEDYDILEEIDEEESQDSNGDEEDLEPEADDDSVELTDIEDFRELESLDPERDFRLLGVSYGEDDSTPLDLDAFSDALDDLDPDEFDPSARGIEPFGVDIDGGLTRRDRASQIAEELGLRYGWSEAGIQVLAKTFARHGWSASRVAIEREMKKGLTPDELKIALDVRDLWKENVDFGMSFSGIGNQIDRTYIAHRFWNMSWPCAFSLIRAFDSYPDTEEIEQLLLDLHERWKSRSCLRHRFPFFYYYIVAYTEQVGRTPDLQAGWWALDELATGEDEDPDASHVFFEE